MKNILKNTLLLILGFTILNSCSKSDSTPSDNPVGGDAYRMQIVTIDLPNTNLASNEYHGSIGNLAVTLIKSEDHKIVFTIPSTVGLGNQTLVINDLYNMKVTYNIKDYILTDTADATIAPFQNNMNTFQATSFGNTATQNAITSFNQIYANASAEDKIKMATLYKVNQNLFDTIILNDFSNITGKNTSTLFDDVVLLVKKHTAAVIAMAAGLALTLYGVEPLQKAIGLAILTIGFNKAVGYGQQAATTVAVAVSLAANGTDGQNGKNYNYNTSSSVILTNNVATTISLNLKDRTFITSDSDKTETITALFFKYFNIINGYVDQVNPVIQWINNNVPFANFSLLSPETVSDTCPTVNNPIDSTRFQKLTFSITDPKLSLQNASFSSDGQLSLNIKIVGNATAPVQSTLHYSYADDLTSFSGTLPITVSNELTIGQPYQGGIIFYILQPGDSGYVSGETHGFIAALTDVSGFATWFNGTNINTGAYGVAIGTGKTNTDTIINSFGSGSYAAQLCKNYNGGGYTDWFLPSLYELNQMYLAKSFLSNLLTSYYYWSSSQDPSPPYYNASAWKIDFSNGTQYNVLIENHAAVRPVRAF
jgi:hypothetical protein